MTPGRPQPLELEEVAGVEVNGEWECRHGSGPEVKRVSVRDYAVLLGDVRRLAIHATWRTSEAASCRNITMASTSTT